MSWAIYPREWVLTVLCVLREYLAQLRGVRIKKRFSSPPAFVSQSAEKPPRGQSPNHAKLAKLAMLASQATMHASALESLQSHYWTVKPAVYISA
jgi:hypothetical protein